MEYYYMIRPRYAGCYNEWLQNSSENPEQWFDIRYRSFYSISSLYYMNHKHELYFFLVNILVHIAIIIIEIILCVWNIRSRLQCIINCTDPQQTLYKIKHYFNETFTSKLFSWFSFCHKLANNHASYIRQFHPSNI